MEWHLTVIDADNRVLFGGNTRNREEVLEVAAEAARRRPSARILLRHPMGRLYTWTPEGLSETE